MNTEAPANATDVIEESADSLVDFIHSIIPVDWLSTIVVVAIMLFVTAVIAHLATKLIRRILSTDASPLHSRALREHRARRHLGDRREHHPVELASA